MSQYPALDIQHLNLPGLYAAGSQIHAQRGQNKLNDLKIQEAERKAQVQNKLTDLYAPALSGDKNALNQIATLDLDTGIKLQDHLGKMDEATRKKVEFNADQIGRAAQWADTPEKWDQAIDYLTTQGIEGFEQYRGQFSPQARQMAITQAMSVKDQVSQTFEREKFAETRRHNQATEANSRANQNTFGSPIQAIGPDGQPIFVQVDKSGNVRPLQGVTPQPKSGMRIVMGSNGEMTYESGAPGGRPLPSKAINDIAEAGSAYEDVNRLTSTFKPEYGGYKSEMAGDVVNWAKRTFGDDSGQAQWWQDYQNQKNIVRNTLFGAALTATEKAEFDKAQINPGMSSQEIEKNLDRQERAARRAAAKLARTWRANGYSEQAIQEALGGTAGLLDEPGASGVVVRLPDGTQVEFPDQQSADRYKKAAGLN